MSTESDLVQCEVTGNWIPADEVITFQGKRVGAEGKAILLERLRSGEEGPGALVAPSVFARFGGMFVDGIIGSLVGAVIAFPIGFLFLSMADQGGAKPVGPESPAGNFLQTIFQLFASIVLIGYFAYFHSRTGQTPGKKMAHTKVVTIDGGPVAFSQAFWRGVYFYGPNLLASALGVIVAILVFGGGREPGEEINPAVRGLLMVFIGVSAVSGIYAVVNILFALFDRSRQRAIHDRLAGTRVIRVA